MIPLNRYLFVVFLFFIGSPLANSTIPEDPLDLAKRLCSSVDLKRPELKEMKQHADAGRYLEAMAAWRNQKVLDLRNASLGKFGWHGDMLNGKRLSFADYCLEKITLADYERLNPPTNSFFVDQYHVRNTQGVASPIDWLNRDPKNMINCDPYANFYFVVPFAAQYWKQNKVEYLNKFFQISADFSQRQKNLVAALDPVEQKKITCGWTTSSGSALSQGIRVANIIKSLGVLCKSLPDEGPKSDWSTVLEPRNYPLKQESINTIPADLLAQIALSLVQDHPPALLQKYLKEGAVPNQRVAGINALLMISTQFAEFLQTKEIFTAAKVALTDILNLSIHIDGGMLEQSFNYNLGDMEAFLSLLEWIKPFDADLAELMESRIPLFYQMASSISSPLGYLPALSSYRSCNPPPLWNNTTRRKEWFSTKSPLKDWNNPLSSGIFSLLYPEENFDQPLLKPAFTSIAFPYSGYYVQRSNWSSNALHLFFLGSRPSRGHSTQGSNAIQLTAYGRPMLITAGVPVYFPEQLPIALRPEFAMINELMDESSSWKTNTILVDESSQVRPPNSEVLQVVPKKPLENRWYTSSAFDYMEGFYNLGYNAPNAKKVIHFRQIIFIRDPGLWCIIDTMNSSDDQTHDYLQNWNMPGYGKTENETVYGFAQEHLQIDREKRILKTIDPEGPNITMQWVGLSGLPVDFTHKFGEKKPWRGWFSLGFGNLVPAHQIGIHFKLKGSSTLITVIQPRPTGINEAIQVTDLSPKENPSASSCQLKLPHGEVVTLSAANQPQKFSSPNFSGMAQLLFSIKKSDGRIDGLIISERGIAKSEAFHVESEKSELQKTPILIPSNFSWKKSSNEIFPSYDP